MASSVRASIIYSFLRSAYTGYTQKNGAVSKITRNLFLNLTRAQRTPSAAATVQVSHALPAVRFSCYCGAAGPVYKMASQQEKAFCVLRFEVSSSAVTLQREFRARFGKDAPRRNNITRWYQQFVETGCLCKSKSPGRPRVSDDIERACEAFLRSPRKSVARASRKLDMPKWRGRMCCVSGCVLNR